MKIDNASEGSNFEPDALLDIAVDYDARIVGIAHVGTFEKDVWKNDKKTGQTKEEAQAIIIFELTEKETYVPRGKEGEEVMKPRFYPMFVKYSSHEKSNLFGIAKKADPKAATIVKKQGIVDTPLMLGKALTVMLKTNKDGDKQNLTELKAYNKKFVNQVGEMTAKPFLYCVNDGEFADTTIGDVPLWILKYATNKAIDAEQFKQLEAIEDHIEAEDDKKDDNGSGSKLDGDENPDGDDAKAEKALKVKKDKAAAAKKAKAEAAAEAKAAEEAAEDTGTDDTEKDEDVEKEKKTDKPPRKRRERKAKEPEVDPRMEKSIEDLEDAALEAGLEDGDLDDLNAEHTEDDDLKKALIEATDKAKAA